MYHRFSTDVAVPAFDVQQGDVLHAATCSQCGEVTTIGSVVGGEDARGGFVTIEAGCACGTSASFTMRADHVLSYSGTLALL